MFLHRIGRIARLEKGAAPEFCVVVLREWTSIEALLPSWPLGAYLSKQACRQQRRFRAAPFFFSWDQSVVARFFVSRRLRH